MGSGDAIAGLGAGMSAGRLRLPEASEALPLGWLVLSWGWEGLEGNLVQPAPWALNPQGVPQTGFSGWGAGPQARSRDLGWILVA